MRLNAAVLNSSDKVLMRLVALGEVVLDRPIYSLQEKKKFNVDGTK